VSRLLHSVLVLSAGAVLAFAPVVRAASADDPSKPESRGGVALYLQAGFSTATPHLRGGAVGGAVLVSLNGRLALEGSGAYLDRGSGASAASLSGSLVLSLVPGDEKAVPYLVGGVGLHRASFDTRDARFSGPAPAGEMGSFRYRHTMVGAPDGWDLGALPPFYAERMQGLIARDGRSGRPGFDDPALVGGAGVRIHLGKSWSAREDARVQLLLRDGEPYPVWSFTIQFGRGL